MEDKGIGKIKGLERLNSIRTYKLGHFSIKIWRTEFILTFWYFWNIQRGFKSPIKIFLSFLNPTIQNSQIFLRKLFRSNCTNFSLAEIFSSNICKYLNSDFVLDFDAEPLKCKPTQLYMYSVHFSSVQLVSFSTYKGSPKIFKISAKMLFYSTLYS